MIFSIQWHLPTCLYLPRKWCSILHMSKVTFCAQPGFARANVEWREVHQIEAARCNPSLIFEVFFFPTKRRQFRPEKKREKNSVRRFPENVYPFHHSMAGSEESCQNHSKSQVKKDIKFWWLILIPWQDFKKSLIPRVFAAFHLAECRDPTWRTPLYIWVCMIYVSISFYHLLYIHCQFNCWFIDIHSCFRLPDFKFPSSLANQHLAHWWTWRSSICPDTSNKTVDGQNPAATSWGKGSLSELFTQFLHHPKWCRILAISAIIASSHWQRKPKWRWQTVSKRN